MEKNHFEKADQSGDDNVVTIVTHSGIFHCDDVVAVAILTRIFPDAEIVRTREITPEMLSNPDVVVVDVGGQYDHQLSNLDHHQRGGPTREDGTPYSGAGLVWSTFGGRYLMTARTDDMVGDQFTHIDRAVLGLEDHRGILGELWSRIDREIFVPIDLVDNGLMPNTEGHLTLQRVVSAFNPSWEDEGATGDSEFRQAVKVVGPIIDALIVRMIGTFRAAGVVEEAATSSGPDILVLPRFAPWQEAFFELKLEHKLIVFESRGEWRVQAIPSALGGFDKRVPLPEAWAGLRGGELVEMTGVDDATFCHPGRFIAGAGSREGAMALANLALGQ